MCIKTCRDGCESSSASGVTFSTPALLENQKNVYPKKEWPYRYGGSVTSEMSEDPGFLEDDDTEMSDDTVESSHSPVQHSSALCLRAASSSSIITAAEVSRDTKALLKSSKKSSSHSSAPPSRPSSASSRVSSSESKNKNRETEADTVLSWTLGSIFNKFCIQDFHVHDLALCSSGPGNVTNEIICFYRAKIHIKHFR